MTKNMTPYTGKHSAGSAKQSKQIGGEKTPYAPSNDNRAPASELGGSLSRKGKHEITPYGGCKK